MHNQLQWGSQDFSMGEGGDTGVSEAIGGLEEKSPALGNFCNFSIKITHFMHISLIN